ncbi:MAG: type IV pilus modification PilV family protein, partial [Actinomycetota bacterium]
MRRPGWLARVRVRAHSDERGFTLLETVIAVTVVFGSLLMLAYTATIGFTYASLARERQSATGLANQVMEQVRGLATDRFVKGLSSSDLAGDPNIVLCGTDYHFKTCSGDHIVHTPGLPTAVPLVPHRGAVSDGFPTAFDWAVYVTNNDPALEPYVVTVIVSWTGGRTAGAHYVQSQSMVFDPKGCLADTVHPFPGPCQPIFVTDATRDSGRITITGTITGLGTFKRAALVGGGARSEIQSEQVSLVQGTASLPGAELVLDSGTQTVGLNAANTSADGNPTTVAGTYSSSTLSPATGGS